MESDPSHTPVPLKTVFVGDRPTEKRLRKSRLVVLEGPDAGKEQIIVKEQLCGGRSSVNDLVLADKAISGLHFEIIAAPAGYVLRDLGSTNGTFCGDIRVREVVLPRGATFRAGNTRIRIEALDEEVHIPLSREDRFDMVVGASVKMREIFATLEKVAPSDLTVMIEGETGTGKERVAQAIHNLSRRAAKPFVVQDCGSIPRELIESILFGHEKGSFTGAHQQHRGCFEQANGGTIFLDEIGELDLGLQPKLLRVLETHELKRVGGDRMIKTDVRVIAATNRDLRTMVEQSRFREDLYFRLSVIQIRLPPLRERLEDIPLLAREFLDDLGRRRGDAAPMGLAADALDALMAHAWPGNVRELKNVIERAASLAEGPEVTAADLAFRPAVFLPPAVGTQPGADEDLRYSSSSFKDAKQEVLDRFERKYLQNLMEAMGGNISRASGEAGLTRFHLRELLKKHGLGRHGK